MLSRSELTLGYSFCSDHERVPQIRRHEYVKRSPQPRLFSEADVTVLVIVRLNRASAARRDDNRSRGLPPTQGQDATCLSLFREMIGTFRPLPPFRPITDEDPLEAGWQHRQKLLTFCTETVGRDLEEKERRVRGQEAGLDRSSTGSLFEEQVLVSFDSYLPYMAFILRCS
jgi:hypothetical protein